jgi:hypothetical protein
MDFKRVYMIHFSCFNFNLISVHFSDCGPVKKIGNGKVTLDKTKSSKVGATATLKCSPGFRPNQEKISCSDNGKWEKARCIIIGIVQYSLNTIEAQPLLTSQYMISK